MNSNIWLIRDGHIIYMYVYNPVELGGSCVAAICVLFEVYFIQFIKATLEPTSPALTSSYVSIHSLLSGKQYP